MQFRHTQEINAPVDYVFKRATNFSRFENTPVKEGVSFKRRDRHPVRIGTQWRVSVPIRGRVRRFNVELSEMVPPRTISYRSVSLSYQAALSLTFTPTSAESCRLDMILVAQSRSFSTSMVFNTIRLARKRINRRIRERMERLADRLEEDYLEDVEQS